MYDYPIRKKKKTIISHLSGSPSGRFSFFCFVRFRFVCLDLRLGLFPYIVCLVIVREEFDACWELQGIKNRE
jgi:hypothetical protein